MAAVRNKNSRAELALRRHLHARGLRYRLHASDIIGCPDIIFRSRKVAVFVDGDYWHGNAWRLRGLPSLDEMFPTNREFWVKKIERNMARDREVTAALTERGWTVVRIWESDVLANPTVAADRVEQAVRSAH